MAPALTRRSCAAAAIGAALCGALPARAQAQSAAQPSGPDHSSVHARAALEALEARNGGRLGVVALDTGSGRRIDYRAEERFAMCSTHKLFSAAAVLTMVDQGHMKLDRRVPFGRADLLEYAPITRKNVDAGLMTVDALCEAAIEWSDNTAGNLLLGLIGGPTGWTRYARSIGDTTSRLDRIEPELNTAIPGDPRDTTTPGAMVRDLDVVLLGKALSDASRVQVENWLLDSKITGNLLHAGLPNGWHVGDKSGSGERGSRNDIAIIMPPEAAPILAAVFYTESAEPLPVREKVIAETGRIIAQTFGT
jgi:beta-lactamase class A